MNKRAWIRIAEAVIAIMILLGVLLLISTQQKAKERVDISDYVYDLQMDVLNRISNDADLRQDVLNGKEEDEDEIEEFARPFFPLNFEIEVKICELASPCNIQNSETIGKDVFVEERIIAGTLQNYEPKKVRLFVWEGE